MRHIKFTIFAIIFTLLSLPLLAQDIGIDFKNIRVDELSNDQIIQLYERMQERGLTISEVENLALARGMNPSEVSKLRSRINEARSATSAYGEGVNNDSNNRLRRNSGLNQSQDRFTSIQQDTLGMLLNEPQDDSSKVFGSDIFRNRNITFEPSLNIPTPKNYTLGSGDELFIDIWGASETTYQLTVSPDGTVQVSNVGPIFVSGLTIEDAKERLTEKLSNIYSGLKGPDKNTYIQVTLGSVRSIKVSIVGKVTSPGTYTLSSFASVFNALYSAGGPNDEGSYRSIKVLRDGKVFKNVDLYEFLVSGDLSGNITLQDQDIIKIDPYVNRITVEGQTKNIGLFETKEGETFDDLLEYTSGFNQFGYKKTLKVKRKTETEKKILDIQYPEQGTMVLKSGDVVTIQRVLDRFENKVTIEGSVFRPGEYELEANSTLKQLLSNAEGVMGDAYLERAIIYRTKEDYSIEAIPVNLTSQLTDSSATDILLQKDDVVKISSIFDLRELRTVKISGSVLNPGTYRFVENSSLKDLIFEAEGFKEDAAPYNIEIARRIPDVKAAQLDNEIADIISVSIENGLLFNEKLDEVKLMPFDQVFVRKSPNYETQKTVTITGEVLYPGEYALSTRDFRLTDLVQKSGGITQFAYVEGASLTRDLEEDLMDLDVNLEDSLTTQNQNVASLNQVGIRLEEALDKPNSNYDLLLQEGDVINIPRRLQTVQIRGEVLYPINARFENGKSFKSYIGAAGGFTEKANNKRAYIVYANGEVDRTKKFLFFRSYPDVKPGSVLIIPPKQETQKLSTAERITVLSTIVSLAAIVTNTIFQIRRN